MKHEEKVEALLIAIFTELTTNKSQLQVIQNELLNLKANIENPENRDSFFVENNERLEKMMKEAETRNQFVVDKFVETLS